MIEQLPTVKPDTPLLDTVAADLSTLARLDGQALVQVADELGTICCMPWPARVGTLAPAWAWSN